MKIIAIVAACALLAPTTFAQIEDGYYSDGQGYVVKVEISDSNGSAPGVDVTITDAGGSRTTTGVEASGSTPAEPEAKSFPEGTTPRGSTKTKGEGGKVKKQNAAGDWITLTKVEKPKNGDRQGLFGSVPIPGLDVNGAPGEEGGSLPGGPQKL